MGRTGATGLPSFLGYVAEEPALARMCMIEALSGDVARIVYQQIRRDETPKAEDLLPELSEFMLAPFLGAVEPETA